jgi:hypothetical protein
MKMMQIKVIEKKLHRLTLAYMEETMRRKINYFYVDYLATRIRQEETKLTLLKIGSHADN